jgi:hypothetical protein
MTTYQVVAECAHATIDTPYGATVTLLLKGATVPEDAPQLAHLLEIGAVAKAGDDETGGVDASGIPLAAYDAEVPAGMTTTPVPQTDEKKAEADKAKADADVEAKRADAKAKLPEDGSLPDGRAGKDVWVEWLAANGYDPAELAKQDKAELVDLAKKVDADRK